MNAIIPLAAYPAFSSRDVEETCSNVAALFSPHQFQLPAGKTHFHTQINEAHFGSSSLVYISYGTAAKIETDGLHRSYLVQIPCTGQASIAHRGHRAIFDNKRASIVSPDDPLQMDWSEDCAFYSVRLDRKAVESKLATLIGHQPDDTICFDRALDLQSNAGKLWTNTVELLQRQLHLPLQNARQNAILLAQLEETLCATLLQLAEHNYSDALRHGNHTPCPRSVKRACEHINNNLQHSVSSTELAAIAGVATATLNRHFQHFLHCSPSEYARHCKLDAVRNCLLQSDDLRSVTDIALSFGFNHLGRFSEYYRRQHGELPSQTRRS